jgi:CMP-N,N'-diacetyllegionaminic acid synthase
MLRKFKILGISLARGGSKAVKNKNIKELSGKPLIYYTIKEALKSKYLTDYIISTDSKKIKKIAEKYKAEVPFLRPKNLSNDRASSSSALIHAVKFLEKKNRVKYDYIIELMCTAPFKTVKDIDNCIKKIIKTNADSVIALKKLDDHHPARIKKIIKDKIVNFCAEEKAESRRQDLKPLAYVRAGAIYALKRDFLIKTKRRYGSKNSRAYVLDALKSINIDSLEDFLLAEAIIKKNIK